MIFHISRKLLHRSFMHHSCIFHASFTAWMMHEWCMKDVWKMYERCMKDVCNFPERSHKTTMFTVVCDILRKFHVSFMYLSCIFHASFKMHERCMKDAWKFLERSHKTTMDHGHNTYSYSTILLIKMIWRSPGSSQHYNTYIIIHCLLSASSTRTQPWTTLTPSSIKPTIV